MVDSILVVDDDILIRPSLAHNLERTGYRVRSTASADQAPALAPEDYPPEVIFLTARPTKLDQVLGQIPRADNNVAPLFNLDVLLAHIQAAIVDQLVSVMTRWRQAWVPVAFAVGMLLFVLAAPRWMGWVQDIATYEPPTEDMLWSSLNSLLFDPATTFNSLLGQTVQTWLNPSEQTDVPMTLGIIVLAVASVAGLAQLLGNERKTTWQAHDTLGHSGRATGKFR
jgi:CheY-like chemotaxis protein